MRARNSPCMEACRTPPILLIDSPKKRSFPPRRPDEAWCPLLGVFRRGPIGTYAAQLCPHSQYSPMPAGAISLSRVWSRDTRGHNTDGWGSLPYQVQANRRIQTLCRVQTNTPAVRRRLVCSRPTECLLEHSTPCQTLPLPIVPPDPLHGGFRSLKFRRGELH